MLFFVGSGGKVLVTQSGLNSGKKTLTLPMLDLQLSCLTLRVGLSVRPAMQVQGTAGGASNIRVMGEDPSQLSLSGLIVGSTNCAGIRLTQSALATGIGLFARNSVVASTQPIQYSLGDGIIKKAFMVGIDLQAEDGYADVVQFSIALLAEPVIALQPPALFPAAKPAAAKPVAVNNGQGNGDDSASRESASLQVGRVGENSPIRSYARGALADRPPILTSLATASPLGAGVRASDGSLLRASSNRGIVALTN